MQLNNLLYIIGAAIIALLIAVFHYFYKTKSKQRVNIILAFLRFLSLFSLFLLLLNLKFESTIITELKPNLVVAVDDSKSIKYANKNEVTAKIIDDIQSSDDLNNKFDIDFYSFGKNLNSLDTLNFSTAYSDISKPLTEVKELYKDVISPIILITDGIQTYGKDYEYVDFDKPIFPIVVGDTTSYSDLKISKQNVNRYTYLNNKFPVETFINYAGNDNVSANFDVFKGQSKVYSKRLIFSKEKNSQRLEFFLTASPIGKHHYTSRISYLENEKNTQNNSKDFLVEVIDEQSKILLLTSFLHPDVGMLKKSIETNIQRKVDIKLVGDNYDFEDYQLAILYQPTSNFSTIYDKLNTLNSNYLVITGTKTDWKFLNTTQDYFSKNWINSNEVSKPILNDKFSSFVLTKMDFNNFPPLIDKFGDIALKSKSDVLLFKNLEGIATSKPLMTSFEEDEKRVVAIFGENIWRWRLNSFTDTSSFQNFDDFISRIIQYLSANKKTNRLEVDYSAINYAESTIDFNVKYLDKNYRFDPTQKIWINVINKLDKSTNKFPLIASSNSYSTSLSGLTPGSYDFTITVDNDVIKSLGSFEVLSFDIEKQNLTANYKKLKMLSDKTNGRLFYSSNHNILFDELINDNRFKTIQISEKKYESLIDWKWLLGLIVLSLSLEWFIRKYNGLI